MDKVVDSIGQTLAVGDKVAYCTTNSSGVSITKRTVSEVNISFQLISLGQRCNVAPYNVVRYEMWEERRCNV